MNLAEVVDSLELRVGFCVVLVVVVVLVYLEDWWC